ncbi:uncharacterized protein LOC118168023 isoform X3 [Oxyura jamaicensis]|uniref:uncharacterized protein LOC118168023 isoform X3 n=1 Tax=Oxyura jamaicensis TaxID=8884 RepID=UPI0015A5E4AB|nr:uncharacterized protein LOC118168023 isoform X3 [Oxyura jamaicensis]
MALARSQPQRCCRRPPPAHWSRPPGRAASLAPAAAAGTAGKRESGPTTTRRRRRRSRRRRRKRRGRRRESGGGERHRHRPPRPAAGRGEADERRPAPPERGPAAEVEAQIRTQISSALVSPVWRFFTAQILLLSAMDAQRDVPSIPDPSKAAGGLVTASPCMALVIKPKGPLYSTSARTFKCLFYPSD